MQGIVLYLYMFAYSLKAFDYIISLGLIPLSSEHLVDYCTVLIGHDDNAVQVFVHLSNLGLETLIQILVLA